MGNNTLTSSRKDMFYRLYGDLTGGVLIVNNLDNAKFKNAYLSSSGMAAYVAALDHRMAAPSTIWITRGSRQTTCCNTAISPQPSEGGTASRFPTRKRPPRNTRNTRKNTEVEPANRHPSVPPGYDVTRLRQLPGDAVTRQLTQPVRHHRVCHFFVCFVCFVVASSSRSSPLVRHRV